MCSGLCTGQNYFEMAPQKEKEKDKKHSFRDFRRFKKENKKRKEEKLLKVRNIGNTSPKLYDENTESEIPKVCTLSIAVPGSILDNAQSAELRTYLAGQIARAACVFKIDEVSTFNFIFKGRAECFVEGLYVQVITLFLNICPDLVNLNKFCIFPVVSEFPSACEVRKLVITLVTYPQSLLQTIQLTLEFGSNVVQIKVDLMLFFCYNNHPTFMKSCMNIIGH